VPQLAKPSGSLVALPQGAPTAGATSELDLGAPGPSDPFEDVRQREQWHLSTPGPVGAGFVPLDLPSPLAQLYVCSRNQSDAALRFDGAPAVFVGAPFDPAAIVDGDAFTLAVDQAPPTTVRFVAADTTWDALLARIRGAVGHAVADRARSGALRLAGTKTGDRAACDRGFQYGSLELAGAPATLARFGLVAGLTFGAGVDLVVRRRFFFEPPPNGLHAITSLEVSGSAELVTHLAGY
jgi:hypothetical protein